MMLYKWLLLICMIISLAGCIESKKDTQEYVADVKLNAKSKLDAIPPPEKIVPVEYTAVAMRSPFVLTGGGYSGATSLSGHGAAANQEPRPDKDRPREYLEQFGLTSLAMVGTLSKPGLNWGLVRDSNGMIHAVKVGDYIGQNSGHIIAITPDQIRLVETIPNGTGGWTQSRAALTLVQDVEKKNDAAAAPQQKTQSKTQQKTQQNTQPKTQQKAPQPQRKTTTQPIQQPGMGGR